MDVSFMSNQCWFKHYFNYLWLDVDIDTIASFNKMTKLTTDKETIISALKNSEMLEFNADNTKIKRKGEFSRLPAKDLDARTLYVVSYTHILTLNAILYSSFWYQTSCLTLRQENFPETYDHDSLREIFEKEGKVNYVGMPRHEDKTFKGYAFIEFANVEEAKKAQSNLNKYDKESNPSGLKVMFKYNIVDILH